MEIVIEYSRKYRSNVEMSFNIKARSVRNITEFIKFKMKNRGLHLKDVTVFAEESKESRNENKEGYSVTIKTNKKELKKISYNSINNFINAIINDIDPPKYIDDGMTFMNAFSYIFF